MDSKKFLELYTKKGAASGGRPWAGATGIYMVAPSCPANFYDGETCENPVPKHVKIGRASGQGGLGSRIRSYSSYWPHGTTVHAVMITPSYDTKYGTIRDYASARETTLKRVLRSPEVDALGFGSNGKGGKNGSEKVVTSEWVRMQPSELIRYFDAVGPMRHPGDRLYTCNSNQCLLVPKRPAAPKRRQTRVSRASSPNWKALEAVLKNESELGIPGRPVVLTKAARSSAMRPDHPFHKWAVQLVTNQTKQNQLAQKRLENRADYRRKKADNERKQRMRGVLSRAATRRLEREYEKYKRKNPLPRDLAAVQNTVAFRYAPKQLGIPTRPRSSRTKPGGEGVERARSSSARKEQVRAKDKFAFDTLGAHLREASDSSPISAPSLGRSYRNQRTHYDRARTTARKQAHWPMDNERLPLELENAIYERTLNDGDPPDTARTRQNTAKRAPKKAHSPVQTVKACPLVSHSVIKQYLDYTHYNVTGDGRCYFYVILKALGMKLTDERGAVCNLERFFKNDSYFSPRNKRTIQRQVIKGTFGNPEMIIHYSPAIRKFLWDRKIRYIATIQKTKKKPNVVDDYIQDPLRHLVQLSELHGPSTSFILKTFTAKQFPTQKQAFMHATAKKQVITFVHQNFPVGSEHFTVIIPRRVRTFPCLDP